MNRHWRKNNLLVSLDEQKKISREQYARKDIVNLIQQITKKNGISDKNKIALIRKIVTPTQKRPVKNQMQQLSRCTRSMQYSRHQSTASTQTGNTNLPSQQRDKSPQEDKIIEDSGSCAFVDLIGFTKLCNQFAQQNDTADFIADLYKILIPIAKSWADEIINIAGDAFVLWFSANSKKGKKGHKAALKKAFWCSLEMIRHTETFIPKQYPVAETFKYNKIYKELQKKHIIDRKSFTRKVASIADIWKDKERKMGAGITAGSYNMIHLYKERIGISPVINKAQRLQASINKIKEDWNENIVISVEKKDYKKLSVQEKKLFETYWGEKPIIRGISTGLGDLKSYRPLVKHQRMKGLSIMQVLSCEQKNIQDFFARSPDRFFDIKCKLLGAQPLDQK